MTKREAQKIKPYDVVIHKSSRIFMIVLQILSSDNGNLAFQCLMPDEKTTEIHRYQELKVPDITELEVYRYITDKNTRVFIYPNRDTGEYLYSIVVKDSQDFWLDSFKSEEAAKAYIKIHCLQMAE